MNKTILCGLLGLSAADIWAVKQGNGGVTVIDYPNGADQPPVVVCLNQTAHLGGSGSHRRRRPMTSRPDQPLLLQQVQLLEAEGVEPRCADVLILEGRLAAIGSSAAAEADACGARVLEAMGWLLAPALVDPHSHLEDPATGAAETLDSLERSALAAGYGTVALLPRASSWRDRPERLQPLAAISPLQWLLWGSFSHGAQGLDLACHGDQLAAGAIGLAEAEQCPPLALLERGLTLAECGHSPLLLAPREPSLSQGGFVRDGVDALRAGWPTDPPSAKRSRWRACWPWPSVIRSAACS